MSGWIKLHRSILNWEWYDDANVARLFFHLLLTVNYESKKWHGELINAGQLVTSYAKLSQSCGLSIKETRTALEKLKSTGEAASLTNGNYTIITIANWNDYQEEGKPEASQGQGMGKERATTKEYKKERKEYIRQFEELWLEYPKKVNKVEAEKAYIRALKEADHETLISGVKRYSKSVRGKDAEYIAHAATWLNDKRWQDEQEQKQVRRPFNPWKN
jgi:hypothetical protein